MAAWLRRHPAQWAAGTLDRSALLSAANALCVQPGFDAAARHFAKCWQAAYTGNPVLTSVMRNTARYLLLVACVRMDHLRGPALSGVEITPGRLIEFLTSGGRELASVSPSRVKAIIGHARAHGLLRSLSGPGDARQHPLEVTEKLRVAMGDWVAGFLRGIAPLRPLPAAPEEMVAMPGFIGELFTYRLAAFVEDHFILSELVPELRWIMDRERGYYLFLSLLRAMKLQADGSAVACCVRASMAAHAGLSRGTVRNFFEGCREQGWLQPEGAHHRLRLTPAFTRASLLWIALEFEWMDVLARSAWEQVAVGAPRLARLGQPLAKKDCPP